MVYRESYNLEFKVELAKTFLKTVSAFSNYNDGRIIFGVDDNGDIIGLDDVEVKCQQIEHLINDTIKPRPKFSIEIDGKEGKRVVILKVFKGEETPYYYKGRAFKRADTSTVEVDREELNKLVREGSNVDFENTKSFKQDLEFKVLETKLKNITGVEELTQDILKTLGLFDRDGKYNIAGELFADINGNELFGVDIVRFGKSNNQILDRETLNNISILSQYDKAIEIFERYYQYEEIEGYSRVKRELISREAFREALANAIVHRIWDLNAHIQISMYENRVEINSPGGLPKGISIEDYLDGQLSVLRNPIIANLFYRLRIIEKFGTGIRRINSAYTESITKPSFHIGPNSVKVVLPLLEVGNGDLSDDEIRIYNLFKDKLKLTRGELDTLTPFNKSKNLRLLNRLIERGIIVKEGSGPSTKYVLK